MFLDVRFFFGIATAVVPEHVFRVVELETAVKVEIHEVRMVGLRGRKPHVEDMSSTAPAGHFGAEQPTGQGRGQGMEAEDSFDPLDGCLQNVAERESSGVIDQDFCPEGSRPPDFHPPFQAVPELRAERDRGLDLRLCQGRARFPGHLRPPV